MAMKPTQGNCRHGKENCVLLLSGHCLFYFLSGLLYFYQDMHGHTTVLFFSSGQYRSVYQDSTGLFYLSRWYWTVLLISGLFLVVSSVDIAIIMYRHNFTLISYSARIITTGS